MPKNIKQIIDEKDARIYQNAFKYPIPKISDLRKYCCKMVHEISDNLKLVEKDYDFFFIDFYFKDGLTLEEQINALKIVRSKFHKCNKSKEYFSNDFEYISKAFFIRNSRNGRPQMICNMFLMVPKKVELTREKLFDFIAGDPSMTMVLSNSKGKPSAKIHCAQPDETGNYIQSFPGYFRTVFKPSWEYDPKRAHKDGIICNSETNGESNLDNCPIEIYRDIVRLTPTFEYISGSNDFYKLLQVTPVPKGMKVQYANVWTDREKAIKDGEIKFAPEVFRQMMSKEEN